MKISEKMGLNKSQLELDFFDYKIGADTYRFFDPYYIAKKEDAFLSECNEYIETFFNRLMFLLNTDELAAYDLFSHLGEVNQICLGMSSGEPAGKGIGEIDTAKIFAAIKESCAFQDGVAQGLEDIRIFIPGIDKDKVSDMVANIIKKPLIKYTQEQCALYDIALISAEAGYCWDKTQWVRGHKDILVFNDKEYFLFPKNLVSESKRYTANEYFGMYILNYLQQKNIDEDTGLVHKSYDRKGNLKKAYVYKKEIVADMERRGEFITKDWLARFTKENPQVFEKFRKETIDKISNSDYEKITDDEVSDIIDKLINELRNLPIGGEYATQYHHLMSGILELLLYPNIAHPRIEEKIHDGRKRVDIAFNNIAETGFFFLLGTTYDIPCSIIMIECKNYTKDIANPELDQMAGRFSARRGKFGIICCRDLDNQDLFTEREKDTIKDDRGLIIHLTDQTIINLLEQRKIGINIDDFLVSRYMEIID